MWKSSFVAFCPLLFVACASNSDAPGDNNSSAVAEAGVSKRAEPPSELVEGEPMYTVLPLDAIPAIDEPVFVDVMEAMSFMADDEPVLGVVGVKGTAKCYSAWLLEGHEVVNDELDGVAIAATW